jgi:GTP pyrophosphokinase
VFAAIGDGSVTVSQVIRRLFPDAARPASVPVVKRAETTGRVLVEGDETLPYTLAPCCGPVFPQPVVGYITRGSGVTVHALGCPNLPSDVERFVGCRWETLADTPGRLLCRLELVAMNRIGLLSDITGAIAKRRLNIGHITSQPTDTPNQAKVSFMIEVTDLFELADVMRMLERLPGMLGVKRL